jgi:protein-S-isoprenylcysteine O-methyltransferase Ste14
MRPRPTRLLPPGILFLSLMAVLVLDRVVPGPEILPPASRWVGMALFVIAAGLFVMSVGQFRRHGTPLRPFGDPGTLVTGATFRLSRNPIYLGMALVLASVWLYLGSTTPVVVPIVFCVVIQKRFIEAEEEFLTEHFGDAYREYQSKVRRWL